MANNPALTTATDQRLYNLLFDNIEYKTGKMYWLASRCTYAIPSIADFYVRCVMTIEGSDTVLGMPLLRSDGNKLNGSFAVRPVVVLKSDVTEDSIHKIEDQIEERWEYEGLQ